MFAYIALSYINQMFARTQGAWRQGGFADVWMCCTSVSGRMSSCVLDVVGQMEVKPENEPQISNTSQLCSASMRYLQREKKKKNMRMHIG